MVDTTDSTVDISKSEVAVMSAFYWTLIFMTAIFEHFPFSFINVGVAVLHIKTLSLIGTIVLIMVIDLAII